MKKFTLAFFGSVLLPLVAAAQVPNTTYIDVSVNHGLRYLGIAVSVIMTLMTIWFLITVLKFIREKDPTKIKDARRQMINGLIGLFIAVAVWGIIRLAVRTFNVDTGYDPGITCPPGYTQIGGRCVEG